MALYAAKGDGRDRLVSYESLESPMADGDRDIQVRHFQNVTRVVTERVANMISLMGEHVVRSIRQEANQDALTGVNNRRYFDKRIAREFGLVEKHGLPLTLVFLDIDNFGQFNRSYGAPTGDAVLRQFAEVVSAAIRPVDWMARYGGEEFCVVMPATFDEALVAAERLRVMVAEAELSTFDAQRVRITVSIGVAEHRDTSELPDGLVQRASKALQEAKRLGRNRVRGAPLT
jgi:diguanylate cyclase (GGDEF)-like protein